MEVLTEMLLDQLKEWGIKRYKKIKTDEKANVKSIVLTSFIDALKNNIKGYKILYKPQKEELAEKIEEVVEALNINIESVIQEDTIREIISEIKCRQIITVERRDGIESEEDISMFYNIVRDSFSRNINKQIEENDSAFRKLVIGNIKSKAKDKKNEEKCLEVKENKGGDKHKEKLEERKEILLTSKKNNDKRYLKILDLSKHYDKYGNNIKDNEDDTIKDEIDEFVNDVDTAEKYNIYINLFYGASYYFGQQIHNKLGNLDFKLFQRGDQHINWNEDNSVDEEYKLFSQGEKEYGSGKDIALYIGVGSNNIEEVKRFLKEKNILYKELIKFNLDDKNPNSCVKNGTHASQLAEQVMNVLREKKYDIKHIFYRGPVSITFYMGKKSFGIHNVIFYKYIDDGQGGTYMKEMFIK